MSDSDTPAVWQDEMALIRIAAKQYGVDPYFIAAIRRAENGRTNAEYDDNGHMVHPSRAFGVLSVPADTYDAQLRVCCRSVAHRFGDYRAVPNVGTTATILHETPDGSEIPVYSRDFVDWFASIWAPKGADNDPDGLNANWARNVWYQYLHLVDLDHPEKEEDCD